MTRRKFPRCVVLGSERALTPGFCHTWVGHHPCGKKAVSHAQEPPITAACREGRTCTIGAEEHRPKRPEFMW